MLSNIPKSKAYLSGMHPSTPPTPHEKLSALGLALPAAPRPQGWYVPVARSGGLAFVSGQLPLRDGAVAVKGTVGPAHGGLTLEQGREAAVLCLLNLLAALEGNGIPLSSVRRVVKLTGFVQSHPDFHDQPKVLNAASELMTELFGEAGAHARAAVGVNALPLDAAVEIEGMFEVG
jgi:enamine deaminase RidA (YjgF/YER057c/UK114 family)